RNPLLERAAESESDAVDASLQSTESESTATAEASGPDWLGEDLATSRTAIEDQLGTRLDNVFPDDSGGLSARPGGGGPVGYSEWARVGGGGRGDADYSLENFVSAEATLADHLAGQLTLAVTDPARRMIGQYLIDLVDEAGYLAGDLVSVAERLGAPPAEGEAVLEILQGFDPPGVCAGHLTARLALQLVGRGRYA